MLSFLSPATLARRSATHPWLTVGFWIVLIAAAAVSAGNLKFDERQIIYGSDSRKADQRLEEIHGPEPVDETIVVQSVGTKVDDPVYGAFVGELVGGVRGLEGTVTSVESYYETRNESLVSEDRTKLLIPVTLTGEEIDAADTVEPLIDLIEERTGENGFVAQVVGDGSANREINAAFEKDLQTAEFIGIPAALVVLLFVFGAAVAAGMPVVLGLLGILVSVGLTALISRVFGISSIVVNIITMIGLAVGIDYTLFIIERFREERARGVEKIEAIVAAGNTASRAVLFSGITVIIALSGMFIVPANIFQGLAVGAITVVFAAVAIALTLLPALLSLLGDKINWLHLPGRKQVRDHDASENGFWGRTTAAVVRHPVLAIAGSVSLLVAASIPFFTMNLGSAGMRDMPGKLDTVQAFRVLDRDFSAGRLGPAHIVIEGDIESFETQQAIDEVRQSIGRDAAFSEMGELEVNGDLATFSVLIEGDTFGPDARAAVDRLRGDYIPAAFGDTEADVVVGGAAASTNDYVNTMDTFLPIVIGFVLTLSFILLMLVFRSIVIPVKAIVMNLLSVGAAYGLLVLVFQHGFMAGPLGFHQSDSIEAFLPIFLFAILFGLSMDYHVFLLSRIQERFLQTGDNTGAVSYGLRSTAHIITGAAAIMIMVFGGFALGDMAALQQTGFGLAVAVFLDATIVRSVLVPASMEMLGGWNWYLPSWLQWLPKINVDAPPAEAAERRGYGAPARPEFAGAGGD